MAFSTAQRVHSTENTGVYFRALEGRSTTLPGHDFEVLLTPDQMQT